MCAGCGMVGGRRQHPLRRVGACVRACGALGARAACLWGAASLKVCGDSWLRPSATARVIEGTAEVRRLRRLGGRLVVLVFDGKHQETFEFAQHEGSFILEPRRAFADWVLQEGVLGDVQAAAAVKVIPQKARPSRSLWPTFVKTATSLRVKCAGRVFERTAAIMEIRRRPTPRSSRALFNCASAATSRDVPLAQEVELRRVHAPSCGPRSSSNAAQAPGGQGGREDRAPRSRSPDPRSAMLLPRVPRGDGAAKLPRRARRRSRTRARRACRRRSAGLAARARARGNPSSRQADAARRGGGDDPPPMERTPPPDDHDGGASVKEAVAAQQRLAASAIRRPASRRAR